MVRGPHGEQRPSDPVEAAYVVAKLATGETPEEGVQRPRRPVTFEVAGPPPAVNPDDQPAKQD